MHAVYVPSISHFHNGNCKHNIKSGSNQDLDRCLSLCAGLFVKQCDTHGTFKDGKFYFANICGNILNRTVMLVLCVRNVSFKANLNLVLCHLMYMSRLTPSLVLPSA